MAIAVQLDFKGGTLDDYDKVVDSMGMTRGGPGEPGGLFHWVTATDDGIRVNDVWQDRAAFEAFAQSKLQDALKNAGVDLPQPEITFFEVHNYFTAG